MEILAQSDAGWFSIMKPSKIQHLSQQGLRRNHKRLN
jgi:hypothetical protein